MFYILAPRGEAKERAENAKRIIAFRRYLDEGESIVSRFFTNKYREVSSPARRRRRLRRFRLM